jgi:VanZ family protein
VKRLLWPVTSVYWLTLFILTHIPQEHLPTVPLGDKTEHLIAYAGLASLLFFSFRRASRVRKVEATTLLICICYGAIDEWIQAIPIINRSCELYDWFADVTGAALAVAILSMLVRRK